MLLWSSVEGCREVAGRDTAGTDVSRGAYQHRSWAGEGKRDRTLHGWRLVWGSGKQACILKGLECRVEKVAKDCQARVPRQVVGVEYSVERAVGAR